MAPNGDGDGRPVGERFASAASRARRRWIGLDRGWQASLLGLLVVLLVALF